MAVINTAFAFTLINRSMQILQATETSAIINTLMIQVPVLAYFFLGERITPRQVFGLGVILVGVIMVQLFRRPVKMEVGTAPGS